MLYFQTVIAKDALVATMARAKKIRFSPGDSLGRAAPLLMLGSIEACTPLRRRSRRGRGFAWALLLIAAVAATLFVVDAANQGALLSLLT